VPQIPIPGETAAYARNLFRRAAHQIEMGTKIKPNSRWRTGVLARQCQTKQHKMKTISLALISVLACIFSLIAAAQSRPAADLIITNAKVWTVDKSNPAAQAVAVLGDRIVSVGSNSDVNNWRRSEEHTSELQSPCNLVCRLLLEKKKKRKR